MARSKRQRQRRNPPVQARAPVSEPPPGMGERTAESLAELRRELDLTQVQFATRMAVSQRAISHIEHEPNPRVGTLTAYVRALGGRLELRAVLEDRTVELSLPGQGS